MDNNNSTPKDKLTPHQSFHAEPNHHPTATNSFRKGSGDVSAIITTHNRANMCVRAIESALHQTLTPREIIVVDDGSVDKTSEILASRFGDLIKYVYQENRGVSSARNLGARLAKGEFLAFLDSDDYWLPEKLGAQVDALLANEEFGLALTNLSNFHIDGTELGDTDRRASLPRDGWILEHVLIHPSLVPSSTIIRRSLFEHLNGFDESLRTAEDLDLHLRASAITAIVLVERPLTRICRGNVGGLSMLPQTNTDHVHVVRRFIENANHHIPDRVKKRAMFKVLTYNSLSATSDGRLLQGIQYTLNALLQVSNLRDFTELIKNATKTAHTAIKVLIKRALRR